MAPTNKNNTNERAQTCGVPMTAFSQSPAKHRLPAAPAGRLLAACARPLLAGSLALLLAGQAFATPPARPRPEDYPDYGRYIEAAVEYQRNLEKAPEAKADAGGGDAANLCKDSGGGSGESSKEKKKNTCEGRYLLTKDRLPDENVRDKARKEAPVAPAFESLEDTISRATFGPQGLNALSSRTPVQGFGLTEIPPDDLRESGIEGLLGLFENMRTSALTSGTAGVRLGNTGASTSLLDDPALRATLDDQVLALTSLDTGVLTGLLSFGDGYSIVSATVTAGNDSLNIGLTAEVHTPVYIVDRDGLPGTTWAGAGAATVDHLSVFLPYLDVNIRGVRAAAQDTSLLQIDTYSPQPITVDLSDTNIGVAAASADGSWIGPSTPFLRFGSDSVLTISAGTRVSVSLAQPNGMQSAFVTLNGHVGDITLDDISLLDTEGGGSIRVGRLAVRNLDLVDTSIYVDRDASRIVVDLGRGMRNVAVDIERFAIGNGAQSVVGDFYVRNVDVNELRISATPH